MRIKTQEDIDKLRAAIDLLDSCEDLADELEDANYHSTMHELRDFVYDLHIHDFSGTRHEYGDAYEVECVVKGCWTTDYVEVDTCGSA